MKSNIYEIIFTENTSLCDLAKQFDTTPYKILELNNITNILDIPYGQKIKIKEGIK